MKRIPLLVLSFITLLAAGSAYAKDNDLKGRAAVFFGRDDNTGLNAERKGDFFSQQTASLDYSRPVFNIFRPRLSFDVLNASYFEATDNDVLFGRGGAGLDTQLNRATTLETDYQFELFYFPNLDLAASYEHRERIGLAHRLTDAVTFRWGARFSQKSFPNRSRRDPSGALSAIDRDDANFTADSLLSWKISKTLLVRTGFEYGLTDSTDQFHDYYDYESWKWSVSGVAQLCPKLTAITGFSYEARDYASRPLFDDTRTFQNDDIYTAYGTLSYRLQKNLSLSASYSYRQKNSNEPSQKYSGSLMTLGLTTTF